MSFSITYKKLADVNLYHRFFLDDGSSPFDSNPTLKQNQLKKYNFQNFMTIIPTENTKTIIKGHKIVIKNTAIGMSLFIQAVEESTGSSTFRPYIPLDEQIELIFLLSTKDVLFENYSTVPANPGIPFYFSNKRPDTEPPGFQYIDIETTTNQIENFTISQNTFETILQNFKNNEVKIFGIISLQIRGDDTLPVDGHSRHILSASGNLFSQAPQFKIQWANRNTIWQYIDTTTGDIIHTTDPLVFPIVKNGIVGYQFNGVEMPAASPSRIYFEKDPNGTIIKTISEIFIN